jgi:hypothetical protein
MVVVNDSFGVRRFRVRGHQLAWDDQIGALDGGGAGGTVGAPAVRRDDRADGRAAITAGRAEIAWLVTRQ